MNKSVYRLSGRFLSICCRPAVGTNVPLGGGQAFIPVAQGALSHGALHAVRPALDLAAARLLHALATTGAPTVLRSARRFCRALVQVWQQLEGFRGACTTAEIGCGLSRWIGEAGGGRLYLALLFACGVLL